MSMGFLHSVTISFRNPSNISHALLTLVSGSMDNLLSSSNISLKYFNISSSHDLAILNNDSQA